MLAGVCSVLKKLSFGLLIGGELATRRGDFLALGVTHRARHTLGDDATDELILALPRGRVPLRARGGCLLYTSDAADDIALV